MADKSGFRAAKLDPSGKVRLYVIWLLLNTSLLLLAGLALPGSSGHSTENCSKFTRSGNQEIPWVCCIFILVKKFQNLIRHFCSFLWFSPNPFSLVAIIMYCIHCFEKQSDEKESIITVCCYLKILHFISMTHLKWTSTGIVCFCYYPQSNEI